MPCTTIHAMLNSSCTARKTNLGRTQLLSIAYRRVASKVCERMLEIQTFAICAISKDAQFRRLSYTQRPRAVSKRKSTCCGTPFDMNTLPWRPLLSLSWLSKRKRFIPRPCS